MGQFRFELVGHAIQAEAHVLCARTLADIEYKQMNCPRYSTQPSPLAWAQGRYMQWYKADNGRRPGRDPEALLPGLRLVFRWPLAFLAKSRLKARK